MHTCFVRVSVVQDTLSESSLPIRSSVLAKSEDEEMEGEGGGGYLVHYSCDEIFLSCCKESERREEEAKMGRDGADLALDAPRQIWGRRRGNLTV